MSSKIILEHHLALANDCGSKNIYLSPGFVPCVAYKADDELKKKWKEILHNTSIELLYLCRKHFTTLLNKQADQIAEFESLMDRAKEDREAQA